MTFDARILLLLAVAACTPPEAPEVIPQPATSVVGSPTATPPTSTPPTPLDPDCEAAVTEPPAHLDPFYTQAVDADGIPVVASDAVDPAALLVARDIVRQLVAARPDALQELIANDARVAIIGRDQVTTDIPEHAFLNVFYPEFDWDTRTRGVGATFEVPVTSVGEENLLRLANDVYLGENILVHELGHTLLDLGIEPVEPGFTDEIATAFAAADGGWIAHTYAGTNADEYWAEGVQLWFDVNLSADPPDGVHGPIASNAELMAADPALYDLLGRALPQPGWDAWRCLPGS